MNNIKKYWEERFTLGTINHSNQNKKISEDFLLKLNINFDKILNECNKIIEFGCGTGEFSYNLNKKYLKPVLGTDFSDEAVNFGNEKYKNKNLNFKVLNLLQDDLSFISQFDVGLCSNTLEHFKNPYIIINKIINLIDKLIILVPYNQPCVDGYEDEGGPGHVFTFNEKSFDQYKIIDWFVFQTSGWQHSSAGETPLQLAICISKK